MFLRNIWTIFKKEIYMLFTSWTAYIVLFCLLAIYGLFFYTGTFLQQQSKMKDVFSNLSMIALILCPLLGVKMISDEKKENTLSLLYTSPLSILEIVIGKYLAILSIFILFLLETLLGPFYLQFKTNLYWPEISLQYLGFFLLGSTYCAIGLFASSLSKNQLISSIIAFAISLSLMLTLWIATFFDSFIRIILKEITMIIHFNSFNNGLFDLKDFLYFILVNVFLLFLSTRNVEQYRWKHK